MYLLQMEGEGMCGCTRTKDVLEAEMSVIKKHLSKHKWYRHIIDENEAVAAFVWEYAWLMRETFCGKLCPEKERCQAGKGFRPAFLRDISDGELNEFIKQARGGQPHELTWLQLQVIKHHISMHRWFHRLDSYEQAVADFLDKFGWVVEEMYRAAKAAK
jgi:hypothetical protein